MDTPATDKQILIRGKFFDDRTKHPLLGALVVVYDATSGLMQDQTYTTNAGEFVLLLPKPGQYYIIATKDTLSGRHDFGYQPGAAVPAIDIISSRPHASIAERLVSNPLVLSLLGFLFGILSGILGVVWKQWYDSRSLYKVQVGQIGALCRSLGEKSAEISDLKTDHESLALDAQSERQKLAEKFEPLHRAVCALVSQLELKNPDDALVFARRGQQGYGYLLAFKEALSNLEDMISRQPPAPEQWGGLLEKVESLRTAISNLVAPIGWRRPRFEDICRALKNLLRRAQTK